MEVQWQLPFISKAVTVNKYDGAHLSQRAGDKELRGCRFRTHMVNFCLKIGAGMEKKTGERGQTCGGRAFGSEAAFESNTPHSWQTLGKLNMHQMLEKKLGLLFTKSVACPVYYRLWSRFAKNICAHFRREISPSTRRNCWISTPCN